MFVMVIATSCAVFTPWTHWTQSAAAQAFEAPATDAGERYEDVIGEAVQEFQLGNFVEARTLFERAHALRPSARTLRGLGFCAYDMKRYVLAVTELEAALSEPRTPLTEPQRAEVSRALSKAARYVGTLAVEVVPADASITVDGLATSTPELRIDAGDHVVAAVAEGHRPRQERITVQGGQHVTVRLVLVPLELAPKLVASEPTPPAAPAVARRSIVPAPARRAESGGLLEQWWFWTLAGVAVSGATAFAIVIANDGPTVDEARFSSTGLTLHPPQ